MVNDLIKNHLHTGICYAELIDLLGKPVRSGTLRAPNHFYYEVEVKFGRGADDDWVKYVDIEIDKDSCFYMASIIKQEVTSF